MNKLYTNNFKRITTSHNFEEKFKGYLCFLQSNDLNLYISFMSSTDFKIVNYNKFKEDFHSFLEGWLQETFKRPLSLDIQNLEQLFNNLSTTDSIFDEFFSYYNLYKRIYEGLQNELFIFDITLTDNQKQIVKRFIHSNEVRYSKLKQETDNRELQILLDKKFIEVNDDIVKISLKAKYAI